MPGGRGDAGADAVAPSYSVTVLPAAAVPVKVGVVMLVRLSEFNTRYPTPPIRGVGSGGALRPVTLTNGTHSLTAKATDVAGNLGSASGALSVTIDGAAPAAPSVPGPAPHIRQGCV